MAYRLVGSSWPQDTETGEFVNPETNEEYLSWLAQGNTPLPTDPPPAPDIDALRRAAYTAEADPLYFKSMRGEIDIQEWHDKIEEIRLRYPKETE